MQVLKSAVRRNLCLKTPHPGILQVRAQPCCGSRLRRSAYARSQPCCIAFKYLVRLKSNLIGEIGFMSTRARRYAPPKRAAPQRQISPLTPPSLPGARMIRTTRRRRRIPRFFPTNYP